MTDSIIARVDQMEWLEFQTQKLPFEDTYGYFDYVSRWPLFIHLISAALCMGFSAFFHLFSVYSTPVFKTLARLDYSGIVILIYGSTIPPITYVFACGSSLFYRDVSIVLMTVTCSATLVVTMMPQFATSEYRRVRGTIFVCLGLTAGCPAFILLVDFIPGEMVDYDPILYVIGGATYILGAIIYVIRIPERY